MTPLACPRCGSDDLVPVLDDPTEGDASDQLAVPDEDGLHPWPEGASIAHCRACDHDWSPTPGPQQPVVVDDEERLVWIELATGLDCDVIAAVLALEAREARFYDTAEGTARPATVDLATLEADAEQFLGVHHLDAFAVLDAETRYLDHLRSHPRLPGLPYRHGVLTIATADDLHAVLALAAGTDLSRQSVDIGPREWSAADPDDQAAVCDALAGAIDQLCAAGRLPWPADPLPDLGARVEVMVPKIGDGPQRKVPASRFGTATVIQLCWQPYVVRDEKWQVKVRFDEPAGTVTGRPVGVTWVPPTRSTSAATPVAPCPP